MGKKIVENLQTSTCCPAYEISAFTVLPQASLETV